MTGTELKESVKPRCRIAWKSNFTGLTGHGDWFNNVYRRYLQRQVEKNNRLRFPNVEHWIELCRLLYGVHPAHFFIDNTTPCGIDGAKKRVNEWIKVVPEFPLAKVCPECMETPEPIKIVGGCENG